MSLFDSIKKHYNHGLFGFPGAHATPNSPPIDLLVGAVSKGKDMKDQTIDLPPLFLPGASGGYTKEEMQLYAREAVEADRKRQGDSAKVLAELVALIPLADTLNASASCQDLIDYFKGVIADRKRRGEPVTKGWKLVPETPTSKQIVHMACQIKGADADGWFRTDGDDWPEYVDAAERAYKWALSEAPQPAALAEWLAAQAQPVAFAKDGVLFWHGEHASWRGFNGDLYLAAQAQPVVTQQMTTAARDVLAERRRQVEEEGWTAEHDDSHHTGEMALAAGCYAMYAHHPDYYGTGPRENRVPRMWPWAEKWWKQASPRRMLVKAGALILAEIERIDRVAARDVLAETECIDHARRIEGGGNDI